MKTIEYLFSSELIEALGWTLAHSVWQGALLTMMLFVVLVFIRNSSAQLKYFISFVSLLCLLGWSAATFVHSYNYAVRKVALKENIISNPGFVQSAIKQDFAGKTEVKTINKAEFNIQIIKIRGFLQRNFYIVCTFWIIGILFLGLRLIGGFIYLQRIRSTDLVSIDKLWMDKLEELAGKLQIRRKVEAFFSPLVNIPLTIGSIKPVILFPVSAFTGFSAKEIEAIIAHELAHVLRHDYFFNIIQSIMEILFFYNPAVWVISTEIRRERENSCDNIAIGLTGDRLSYARTLAAVQVQQYESEQLAMAFLSSSGNILQRIKRLQKTVNMKTNFTEGTIAVGIIAIGLTLASFTFGDTVVPKVNAENKSAVVKIKNSGSSKQIERKHTYLAVDSILDVTRENLNKNEELGQNPEKTKELIEIALSEKNKDVSVEMLDCINEALEDMNIEKIVQEAMDVASKAIQAANEEIDHKEIQRDLRDAARSVREANDEVVREMKQEIRDVEGVEKESLELGLAAAKMGLEVASAVLENLPVEEIVATSLKTAEVTLETLSESDLGSDGNNDEISKDELNLKKKQMKLKEKDLKRQLEELENQMDSIDKKYDVNAEDSE
jgi:bla regulator protein BlaR1